MNSFRQLRHTILALLAVLCLLGLQQGAAFHGLSHVAGDDFSSSQKHLPHAKHCDKCIVYAEVGGGAPTTVHPLFVLTATDTAIPSRTNPFNPARRATVYSARAPPLSA